jgi:hypothetical protein
MWPPLFVYRNGRFVPLILLTLLLLGAITACQNGTPPADIIGTLVAPGPTPDSAATAWAAATRAAQPTATPATLPGASRANPLAAGSLISIDNWDVQIVDVKRGDEAWQLIRQSNRLNDPPDPDREYLLVQAWIKNKSQKKGNLWLDITGQQNKLYKRYQANVISPEPRLSTNLEANEEGLGWLVYTIYQGEGNLILRLEDGLDFRAAAVYIALEEGARLQRSPALDAISPTEWGKTAADPLILGQIATTQHWQMQVKEISLGQAAYDKLLETNRFNDPPEPGMQYGLAYIWLRYMGPGEAAAYVSTYRFETLDSSGTVYERPSLVIPRPELLGDLYAGGEIEGWLAIQIPETETAPVLRLEMPNDEPRYLSLAGSGR